MLRRFKGSTHCLAIMKPQHNPALNPAPFSRWTLHDKPAQRRLALRWASQA